MKSRPSVYCEKSLPTMSSVTSKRQSRWLRPSRKVLKERRSDVGRDLSTRTSSGSDLPSTSTDITEQPSTPRQLGVNSAHLTPPASSSVHGHRRTPPRRRATSGSRSSSGSRSVSSTLGISTHGTSRVASRASARLASSRSRSISSPPGSPILTLASPRLQQIPSLRSKGRNIYPIMSVPRYDRGVTIPRTHSECTILPMTLSFSRENIPSGWVLCTHPEGAPYFHNPTRRIYTDADIRNIEVFTEVNEFINYIEIVVEEKGINLPDDIELVVDLQNDADGRNGWCYYFVHHNNRSLFWLHEFDAMSDLEMQEVECEMSPDHTKHQIESRYWHHIEMFPHHRRILDGDVSQLMGIILHANIDMITSTTSTAIFTSEDLTRMADSVKSAIALGDNAYTACIIGRLMSMFAHQRYLSFHGQLCARLNRGQSVHGGSQAHTIFISIFSPLFFNAPRVHLRDLEKVAMDGLIALPSWSQFMGKLQTEWQEMILYATVLLNANVAFLAIPSVDTGADHRTPEQISSYLSILTSIGSILSGLLLIRYHRVKPRDKAANAVILTSMKHPSLGLGMLALTYSLPYALLMWGMMTFLLAFSLECFFDTHDVTAIYTTAAAWIAVAVLIFWCIYVISGCNTTITSVREVVGCVMERAIVQMKKSVRKMRYHVSSHTVDPSSMAAQHV
ncbi:hypothetical protein A0H81_07310 [Grifola frondosa]|uniref:WW domain-containing protein n=1 Tax=Grifola frondosa TaxID=5627 RepID=A0A1C7M8Q1_GRIFR|nr:hypothetical protein A0H81_07310 [Grifola frondosa]